MLKASAVEGAARAELLVGDRVIEQAGAMAAPLLVDRQREEAFVAQPLIILDRVARLTIVRRRPGGEIGRQLAAFLLQALLFGSELKIHVSNPPWHSAALAIRVPCSSR